MKLAAKYFSCGKFCLHGILNLYSLWIFDVFKLVFLSFNLFKACKKNKRILMLCSVL